MKLKFYLLSTFFNLTSEKNLISREHSKLGLVEMIYPVMVKTPKFHSFSRLFTLDMHS